MLFLIAWHLRPEYPDWPRILAAAYRHMTRGKTKKDVGLRTGGVFTFLIESSKGSAAITSDRVAGDVLSSLPMREVMICADFLGFHYREILY
jgi:hypothetical protein